MTTKNDLLSFDYIRFIDHSTMTNFNGAMHSFAIDDSLAISVGDGASPPVTRLWVHDRTIVLGIADARLPYLKDGVNFLEQQGYQVLIRNSGGLAVVLDQGVLNVSLIFPNAKKLDIHDAYGAMVQFIRQLFASEGMQIDAFEVKGSYCPGDFDLSIGGKKFAGISQRKVKDGTAVQIYLCVEGSGSERAQFIKEFYKLGTKGEQTKFAYPTVKPETMSSLSELYNKTMTVEDVRNRILFELQALSNKIVTDPLSSSEWASFEKRLEYMELRNEKALGSL
ncbi:lipoate--protein ligase family protein [Salirhabdus salicampi]|uniref:lipoate--protein ligase family protein n=1 Tax=Salirhabdus salicampi TaxID=476102 RepID=UPI0020C33687|nr:lipoate--protein ligase family protein [Salirhabdus salicampi]MCP8617388.1 lipoate--protein ligase family protein [Salirhabdus salicampi]